jgi:hypothetical protein
MGRKGDSKRKTKKIAPVASAAASGNSIVGAIKRPAVQSIVPDKGSAVRGNPSSGMNKSQRKGG